MARPDRHRDALLTAAGTLLRRRGYLATSTAELLREAGATNGSLYHHFPGGKEELAQAAIAAAGEHVDAALRRALTAFDDPANALRAWIDALAAGLETNPLDGCPVAVTAIEAAAVSDALRAAADGAFARWRTTLEWALGAATAQEHAHLARSSTGSDPARVSTGSDPARVVLSAIEGALLLDRTAGGTEHLRAVRAALPALLSADR